MIARVMIIACPACSTRYTVPDSSIGADGRIVRCAKCRHSWFQHGPEPDDAPVPAEPNPQPEPPAQPKPSPAAPAPWPPPAASWPDSEAVADQRGAHDFDRTPSSFAHEPPFRPRRNRMQRWLIAAAVLLLIAVAVIGAIAELGAPDWFPIPHGGLIGAAPDLVLDFPADRQKRRPLPNGGDFFNISGSIRNSGQTRQTVPTLMIVLRDSQKAIVYTLETAAPKPVLAPGESETINQAIIDAPRSARSAEIGWKPS